MKSEQYRQLRDWLINYKGNDLSIKKFKKILSSKVYKKIDRMTVDRRDSDIGYCINNMVKSCWFCNYIKGSFINEQEMLIIGPRLMNNIQELRNNEENKRPNDGYSEDLGI